VIRRHSGREPATIIYGAPMGRAWTLTSWFAHNVPEGVTFRLEPDEDDKTETLVIPR
jgi:hypothetical protein